MCRFGFSQFWPDVNDSGWGYSRYNPGFQDDSLSFVTCYEGDQPGGQTAAGFRIDHIERPCKGIHLVKEVSLVGFVTIAGGWVV
jgi:hypothetical protein